MSREEARVCLYGMIMCAFGALIGALAVGAEASKMEDLRFERGVYFGSLVTMKAMQDGGLPPSADELKRMAQDQIDNLK